MGHVQNVQVVVRCPACGAQDYEIEFDETELSFTISQPCDECPANIYVDVAVHVQAEQNHEESE